MSVVFASNRATVAQIALHMAACDHAFLPPLSSRVDLRTYASKMAARAQRIEAWSGGELIGLVAAYCDDSARQRAFITNVSVLPAHHGRGIGNSLVTRCLSYLRSVRFARVELEVNQQNMAALALYAKHGFEICEKTGLAQRMSLTLEQEVA